jgi:ferredoxin
MAYLISSACTKCGACLSECPTGSILEGKTQFHIDADTCANHAACVGVCPVNAISLKPPAEIPVFRGEEEEEEES